MLRHQGWGECSGLSCGTDAPPGEYLSIYMFEIMLDPVLIHIEAILSCCWSACCCWAGWTRGHSAIMYLKLVEEGCKIKLWKPSSLSPLLVQWILTKACFAVWTMFYDWFWYYGVSRAEISRVPLWHLWAEFFKGKNKMAARYFKVKYVIFNKWSQGQV